MCLARRRDGEQLERVDAEGPNGGGGGLEDDEPVAGDERRRDDLLERELCPVWMFVDDALTVPVELTRKGRSRCRAPPDPTSSACSVTLAVMTSR